MSLHAGLEPVCGVMDWPTKQQRHCLRWCSMRAAIGCNFQKRKSLRNLTSNKSDAGLEVFFIILLDLL